MLVGRHEEGRQRDGGVLRRAAEAGVRRVLLDRVERVDVVVVIREHARWYGGDDAIGDLGDGLDRGDARQAAGRADRGDDGGDEGLIAGVTVVLEELDTGNLKSVVAP